MEKKKSNKEFFGLDVWFDNKAYDVAVESLRDRDFDFNLGFDALVKYDMPRSKSDLDEYAKCTDTKHLRALILSWADKAIERIGFLPKWERKRIRQEFVDLYDNVARDVFPMCLALNAGVNLEECEDGYFLADCNDKEEEVKAEFMYGVDVDALREYYNLVDLTRKLIDKTDKMESARGMSPCVPRPGVNTGYNASVAFGNAKLTPYAFFEANAKFFIRSAE